MLSFVFAVAWFGFNLGPMRRHERRAIEDAELYDPSHGDVPGETGENLPAREDGRVSDLIVPVLTLIGVTVAGALYLGITRTEGGLTALAVMENTDVILALFYGGLAPRRRRRAAAAPGDATGSGRAGRARRPALDDHRRDDRLPRVGDRRDHRRAR